MTVTLAAKTKWNPWKNSRNECTNVDVCGANIDTMKRTTFKATIIEVTTVTPTLLFAKNVKAKHRIPRM